MLAVAASIGWFLLDGRLKVNLADEGWLWYGVEGLRHGEVPMRDFSAYDPGRYAWVAGWTYLFGESLVAVRLACVLFQCVAVVAGLLAARRLSRNWAFLACVCVLLCAWMQPRFKLFEQSVSLMAIYAGVLLLERPTLRRHFCVGIFGGLSAIVGRNHGAYHVFAFGLMILWSSWGRGWSNWLRNSAAWAAGIVVGYLPQLLMFAVVPGFLTAYLPYITSMAAKGSTNLPMPIAWPWMIRTDIPFWPWFSAVIEGCWYVAIPLFFIVAAVRVFMLDREGLARHPVFVASVCVSLAYAHFIFSRPDIVHLGHGAPAFALSVIALAFTFGGRSRRLGYIVAPVLLAGAVLANLFQFGISLTLFSDPKALFEVDVRGERMLVGRSQAQVLESARHIANDLARPDEPILFMPHFPTLYPFTGRRSPTKEIYFVFPPDDAKLLAEIKAAGVRWVMLQDYALDGREDLRFRNTNPLVMQYFRENFDRVPIATLPGSVVVLHWRGEPAAP